MSGDHGDQRDRGNGGGTEPLTPQDPRRIGPYSLLGRLGSGGMGRVYLARSEGGRTVAVKVVHEEHVSSGEFRARFRREIEAARRVGEHFTAPVLDADPDAARPWVATGYVPGPSLEQTLLTYGPLPASSVHALADGLLRALRGIHGAGIVHRDLKPSNVLLTVGGPKVIDFGIARALQVSVESMLTSTGMVIGSPGFMAPEQILGEETGTPADVFALGCVLMYAATGQLPFGHGASNQHTVMYRIVEGAPDLSGIEDEPLRTLIARCLAKSPAERPGVDELLADPERPRPSEAQSGAWLPPALVARLAQEAARLLDVEAPRVSAPPDSGEGTGAAAEGASGEEAPAAAQGPEVRDVATFGLRAAPKPEAASPGEATPAPTSVPLSAPAHRRTRRNWAVAAAVIAVLASGGTVALLDGREGGQGAPGAEGPPPGADNSPASPTPSGSEGADGKGKDGEGEKDGKDGKDGKEKGKERGDGSSPGKDGGSSDGAAGDGGSSGDDPASAGEGGDGDSKGSSGDGSSGSGGSGGAGGSGAGAGSGSGAGSGGSDNRVPQGFAGTWVLTSPYVQQPQKVIIYRVAPGGYAVKLITDSGNGGHCENHAKLVSVADGGKRINVGTAHVDEGRSSQILCGDMDPSYFTLDDPSGIRHNVGPAHGDGYHYDRG